MSGDCDHILQAVLFDQAADGLSPEKRHVPLVSSGFLQIHCLHAGSLASSSRAKPRCVQHAVNSLSGCLGHARANGMAGSVYQGGGPGEAHGDAGGDHSRLGSACARRTALPSARLSCVPTAARTPRSAQGWFAVDAVPDCDLRTQEINPAIEAEQVKLLRVFASADLRRLLYSGSRWKIQRENSLKLRSSLVQRTLRSAALTLAIAWQMPRCCSNRLASRSLL